MFPFIQQSSYHSGVSVSDCSRERLHTCFIKINEAAATSASRIVSQTREVAVCVCRSSYLRLSDIDSTSASICERNIWTHRRGRGGNFPFKLYWSVSFHTCSATHEMNNNSRCSVAYDGIHSHWKSRLQMLLMCVFVPVCMSYACVCVCSKKQRRHSCFQVNHWKPKKTKKIKNKQNECWVFHI